MKKIEQLSYPVIKLLYHKFKYVFFTGEYNLNIFGIRSADRKVNAFDDILGVAYQEMGVNKLFLTAATVDPGIPWLLSPMDTTLGSAAIKEGQYRSVWKLGRFRGRSALLQVSPFTCYRDNNRNNIFEYSNANTSSGLYGIHLHEHFQPVEEATFVDKSSAGCVVPKTRRAFYEIISLCIKQFQSGRGDRFTFTLFDETEL